MEKEVVGYCPICSNKLIATKLTCRNCNLDLAADFSLSKYSYLSKDEQDFVALFLSSEGSFKEVQGKLDITYQKAKQVLSDILLKLQLRDLDAEEEDMNLLNSNNLSHVVENMNEHFIIKMIKTKLNSTGGKATIPLISAGKEAVIRFDKEGKGLECDKIPVANQLTWDVFIAAYDITVAQGGEVYKGYARAGKLGSEKLPFKSLEGYVAHAVHGIEEGGSAFSPGFVIAAVLDWIGIMENERGSTVRLRPETVCIKTYEEALHNADTFNKGLEGSISIMEKLNLFRQWYYFEELDSFAPSKFIGYRDMNMKVYEIEYNAGLDGKETERALQKLFRIADGEKKLKLFQKLETFLGKYMKQPNAMTSIHIK